MSKLSRREREARAGTLCIAYIHPGQVSSYFTESLMTTVLTDRMMEDQGIRPRRIVNILQEWSSANVSAARNTVTARFLDQPHGDWLLWIDADMQWEPDAVDKLMAVAHPKERPIVGGLAFGMATEGMFPTIYQWANIDGEFTTVRVRDYPRDEVFPVAATGAAFLLIHRRVLEEIRDRQFDAAFPFFMETAGNGKPVGEDLTFCIRAKIAGFQTFVHSGARIGHHKSHLLTEEEFDKQLPAGCPPDVGMVIPTRGDHPELLRAMVYTSGLPPERVVVVSNGDGPPPDVDLPAAKIHDPGPLNIHRWWNAGIDYLVEQGCKRVAVVNDDVSIAPDTLPRLARGLGSATLALAAEEGSSGHLWMLNVGHGVRPDEAYRWYSGDLQLVADATRAQGVVRVPESWHIHWHATEATEADPDLVALAEADDALYDSRHAGTEFEAVRPEGARHG